MLKHRAFFAEKDEGWYTVEELKQQLARCPPDAMVCVGTKGPACWIESHPGASEPYVLIK